MELTNFQMVLLIVVFVALVAALIVFITMSVELAKKVRDDKVWNDMADQEIKKYKLEVEKLEWNINQATKAYEKLDNLYRQKNRVRINGKFAPKKVETRKVISWKCNTTSYSEFTLNVNYKEDFRRSKQENLLYLVGNDGDIGLVKKNNFNPIYE